MNPIPCRVTAHGEKLHPDQNEVVMYGMAHVVAVDGYLLDAIGEWTLWPFYFPLRTHTQHYNAVVVFKVTDTQINDI